MKSCGGSPTGPHGAPAYWSAAQNPGADTNLKMLGWLMLQWKMLSLCFLDDVNLSDAGTLDFTNQIAEACNTNVAGRKRLPVNMVHDKPIELLDFDIAFGMPPPL
eukprot:TRINITY_DN3029_c0_g5_i1.p2 TRINITY_DN3029_c0_g5~~TRINITY_DN3029_c0_g5_i1.p2  ORF type:complete len:105 (+),score=19.41 TRINITY_DN3029_c0_g5_i1:243-557(+)